MQNRNSIFPYTDEKTISYFLNSVNNYLIDLLNRQPKNPEHASDLVFTILDCIISINEILSILIEPAPHSNQTQASFNLDSNQKWVTFLKNRWERIQNTNLVYLKRESPINNVCLSIAKALILQETNSEKSLYHFLMPSLKCSFNTISEMKLEEETNEYEFILDKNQEYPIPLYILKNYFSALKEGMPPERMKLDHILYNCYSKKHLTDAELEDLINSTKEGSALHQKIQEYLTVVNCADNSIRYHLSVFSDRLFKGSAYNKDPKYKGTGDIADPIALKGLLDFESILNHLNEKERDEILNLHPGKKYDPKITLGYILKILQHKIPEENTCTGVQSERITDILNNPQNASVLDKDIDKKNLIKSLSDEVDSGLIKFESQPKIRFIPKNINKVINNKTEILLIAVLEKTSFSLPTEKMKDDDFKFYLTEFNPTLLLNRLMQSKFPLKILEEVNQNIIELLIKNGVSPKDLFIKLQASTKAFSEKEAHSLLLALTKTSSDSEKALLTNSFVPWTAEHGFLNLLKTFLNDFPSSIYTATQNQKTALMLASQNNQIDTVKYLLAFMHQHSNLNNLLDLRSNQISALDLAITKGNTQIVCLLLEKGATFHPSMIRKAEGEIRSYLVKQISKEELISFLNYFKNAYGNIWLHDAVENNDLPLTLQLLEWGSDPNTPNNIQQTPLHLSCKLSNPNVFNALIQHGALLNVTDNIGMLPSCYAANSGQTEILKNILATHEELLTFSPNNGKTLLIRAILNNHFETAEHLLSYEKIDIISRINDPIDPTLHNMDALSLAIKKKNLTLVELLVNKGASLNVPLLCIFPIDLAISSGDIPIFNFLLEKRADIPFEIATNQTIAIYAASNGQIDMLSKIIETDRTQLNRKNGYGITPLLEAIIHDQNQIVDFLLDQKDIQLEPSYYDVSRGAPATALTVAVENSNQELVQKLLVRGAKIEYLTILSAKQEGEVIKNLIFNAITLSEKAKNLLSDPEEEEEEDRNTPLHRAVLLDDVELIEEFIQLPGLIEFTNIHLSTPLDLAIRHNKATIFNLLKKHNQKISVDSYVLSAISSSQLELLESLIELNDKELSMMDYLESFIDESGDRFVHIAVKLQGTHFLEWLINKNVGFFVKNKDGKNPAHIASSLGRFDHLKKLLDEYPSLLTTLSYDGKNLLSLSKNAGHIDITNYLLHHENLDLKTDIGKTALTIAAEKKDWALFEEIEEKNSGTKRKSTNPEDEPAAKRLKISYKDSLDESSFHAEVLQCFESNNEKALINLLNQEKNSQWDVNHFYKSTAGEDKTLFMLISEKGWLLAATSLLSSTTFLFETSFSITSKKKKMAIHYAAEQGHDQLLQYYLELQRQHSFTGVFKKTKDGYSLLHYSIKSKKIDAVKTVMSFFSKMNQTEEELEQKTSREKLTAIQLSEKLGCSEITTFLKSFAHAQTPSEKDQWRQNIQDAIKQKNSNRVLTLLTQETSFTKDLCKCIQKNRYLVKVAAQYGWLNVINQLFKMDEKFISIGLTASHSRNALHLASEFGHLEIVKRFIEFDRNIINKRVDQYGYKRTALLLACENGHLDVVKFLVEQGAELATLTGKGESLFDLACIHQHSKIISYLKTITESDSASTTVLTQALFQTIQFGTEEEALTIIARLKNTDWDVNTSRSFVFLSDIIPHPVTPLMMAAKEGKVSVIQKLLELGAKTAIVKRKKIICALHYAAKNQKTEVVNYLLEQNTDDINLNCVGTPLHHAARSNSYSIVKLLIKHGADIFIKDHKNKLPIDLTESNKIIHYLIKLTSPFKKHSYKKKFFIAILKQDEDTAITLLRENPKLKKYLNRFYLFDQNEPKTFLMFACQYNLLEIAKALIELGSDINIQCQKTNRTAIFFALKNGSEKLIYFLIQKGANLNIPMRDDKGYFKIPADIATTALFHSLLEPNERSYELKLIDAFITAKNRNLFQPLLDLLELAPSNLQVINALHLNPHLNLDEKPGKVTFLMYACAKGWDTVVAKLLEIGANPKIKGKNELTALHYAILHNHLKIVITLLEICPELIHDKIKIRRQFETVLYFARKNSAVYMHLSQKMQDTQANPNEEMNDNLEGVQKIEMPESNMLQPQLAEQRILPAQPLFHVQPQAQAIQAAQPNDAHPFGFFQALLPQAQAIQAAQPNNAHPFGFFQALLPQAQAIQAAQPNDAHPFGFFQAPLPQAQAIQAAQPNNAHPFGFFQALLPQAQAIQAAQPNNAHPFGFFQAPLPQAQAMEIVPNFNNDNIMDFDFENEFNL